MRYGWGRGRAAGQLQQLSAILDLSRDTDGSADLGTLEAGLVAHASGVLGASVRLGAAPGADEIGAPLPAADDMERWLVAERRTGPPTWQGRYRPDDRQALERIAAIGSAATARLRLLAEIEHLAMHDTLTGLPNRALFNEHLASRVARVERSGESFAVVFVDLDHFKWVNDRYGHPVGDAVLRFVAARLRELCRTGDTVARWGGEEFVILADLAQPTSAMVEELADRFVQGLRCGVDIPDGPTVTTSVSVGIGVYPTQARSAADLILVSDAAMLEAKRLGRDRAVIAAADAAAAAADADADADAAAAASPRTGPTDAPDPVRASGASAR